MRLELYSYRYADAVLEHPDFRRAKKELFQILAGAEPPLSDPTNPDGKSGGVKRRRREPLSGSSGARYFFLPVDQKRLNAQLDEKFKAAGWAYHPNVVDPTRTGGPSTGLKADFKKGRLQVEVQFGNMARWYTDVFKFQLSYSLDEIDAAVLVVAKQKFANLIDENVAYFERVVRELPWAKMSLTLPILVMGIEPADYQPIRECYNRAFQTLQAREPGAVLIPFEERVQEVPAEKESE